METRAMKLRLILLIATAALAACQAKTQQSVENQFQQTQASIENTANTIENATEVSTRAAANEIDAQANMVSNRVDAVERAATGRPADNSTRNSSK
jgi:outer membrane biogenesis lipoprotein LolB